MFINFHNLFFIIKNRIMFNYLYICNKTKGFRNHRFFREDMKRIKLNVLGISYSQTQSGAYALVLTEEEGERRIPIIIGGFEAQAIAIQLEGLTPPRPLTHDLFYNFASAFGISLREVEIYRLEEGVFYAKLICRNGGREITIDARTSDAIALALRFKCPIYTNEDIMTKSGVVLDANSETGKENFTKSYNEEKFQDKTKSTSKLEKFSVKELKKLLSESIEKENYEKASLIRDELKLRKQE